MPTSAKVRDFFGKKEKELINIFTLYFLKRNEREK